MPPPQFLPRCWALFFLPVFFYYCWYLELLFPCEYVAIRNMYLYLSRFSDRVRRVCKSCNGTTAITLFTSCWDKGLTSTLRIPTTLMPTVTGLLICIQHLPSSRPSSTHGPPTSQINCFKLVYASRVEA